MISIVPDNALAVGVPAPIVKTQVVHPVVALDQVVHFTH